MFTTRFEGGAVIQLDYSSQEAKVLALEAHDEDMTKAFLNGKDIHSETASLILNKPVEEVTKEERSNSKATTFGLVYGEDPFSYSSKNDMTVEEAEKLFDNYFKTKPKIKEFIDATHEKVKKQGYIECLHGFRRNLRDVYSNTKKKQNEALRQSVNTLIQGFSAYLTNNALIYIQRYLEDKGFRSVIIMTVHDSIVIDSPPEEVEQVAYLAEYIMSNLPVNDLFTDLEGERIRYPMDTDVEIGTNYNDVVAFDQEEFRKFNSVQGYCKYYLDQQKVEDYYESGAIGEEKKDKLLKAITDMEEEYKKL